MRAVRASLLARVGSAATVAVLATGGAVATAGAANAAASHGHAKLATTLSIKNKVVAHNHHKADALTGVLESRRKGLAGETITLQSRTGTHRKFTAVATGTTDSNGSVTFTIAVPAHTTQYRMVFAGDATHRGSHSNTITITVRHAKK